MAPPPAADSWLAAWQGGLVLGGLTAAALPLALLVSARLPGPLSAVEGRLRDTPGGALLAGGLLLLLCFAAGIAGQAHPLLSLAAITTFVLAAALALAGMVAEARTLGAALTGVDAAAARWGTLTLGWLILATLPLLPVAGTAALLYLMARAAGAAVLAAGRGR